MVDIIIKILDCFGNGDMFTVSDTGKKGLIIHEKCNFDNTDEVSRHTISKAELIKISNAFEKICFKEVFSEHENLVWIDGCILRITIQNGSSKLNVEVCCPDKDISMPETTKLLEACELVCPIMKFCSELDSQLIGTWLVDFI